MCVLGGGFCMWCFVWLGIGGVFGLGLSKR